MCFPERSLAMPRTQAVHKSSHPEIYGRPVDSCSKNPKIFHGLEAVDHGRVLMSDTMETKIEGILESIRPALKADGGDIEFLRFIEEGGVVELRLLGACEDCPISMMTLKVGIERRLRSGVPGIREVQAV